MADYMAALGLFRKIPMKAGIRFGPITVVWNHAHTSATLADFVACLKAHARGVATPAEAPGA